mgnify:CR=1 FL=1
MVKTRGMWWNKYLCVFAYRWRYKVLFFLPKVIQEADRTLIICEASLRSEKDRQHIDIYRGFIITLQSEKDLKNIDIYRGFIREIQSFFGIEGNPCL